MHRQTVASTLAMGLLLLKMSLASEFAHDWQWKTAVTLVVFCAVFLWPGIPSPVGGHSTGPD